MSSVHAFKSIIFVAVLLHVQSFISCDDQHLSKLCSRRCKRDTIGKEVQAGEKEYSAIIDGGSSGSRIRVYEWVKLSRSDHKALPDFKEIHNLKKEPGVSDFADSRKWPELVKYLKELIDSALKVIPVEAQGQTNLYFMATAGMRLLLEEKANTMIANIDGLLSDRSTHPLRYTSPDNSRILSGEEEGVFAWISVNYLKKVFKKLNERASSTYGILELGGASTQIAFAPNGNILADKFPVFIAGRTYDLYVHSYLYYGQNYVDQWIKTELVKKNNQTGNVGKNVYNPCMVRDDTQSKDINGVPMKFIGSGSYDECNKMLYDFVYKVQEDWKCHPKPCSIGTVYQPTINSSMDFVAVGAFVHAFNKLKALGPEDKFSHSKSVEKVKEFCSLDKATVMKEFTPDSDAFTSVPCSVGTYSPLLITRGYRFAEDTNQISVKQDIDGQPAEWTLGAVIYEYERGPGRCRICCNGDNNGSGSSYRFPKNYEAVFLIISLIIFGLYY